MKFIVSADKKGEATGLVRLLANKDTCFHVALTEEGDVEVFAPGCEILDLEEAEFAPKKEGNISGIVSHNSTATQKEKVLALVRAFPFRTARELSRKINSDILSYEAIHKRLPELERDGAVARSASTRACTVTRKVASTWTLPSLL